MPETLSWDQLREGDVLILHYPDGRLVPIVLLPTCRVCTGPELWNQKCACGKPTCSGTPGGINVRTAFKKKGRITIRRDGREYTNG